jgi:hypothetical protein
MFISQMNMWLIEAVEWYTTLLQLCWLLSIAAFLIQRFRLLELLQPSEKVPIHSPVKLKRASRPRQLPIPSPHQPFRILR